jgi:integrase
VRKGNNVKSKLLGVPNAEVIETTLEDFLRKTYLPHLQGSRREGTYENHERYAERLITRFGKMRLRDITKTEVDNFYDDLNREGKTEHDTPLAQATINRIMSFLRATLYKAQTRGIIDRNPCARIELIDEENERQTILRERDEPRLMEHADEFLKPIIQTAILSGLRLGELLNLQWADDAEDDTAHKLDLEQGLIFISHESKSHKRREVPVLPDLEELLTVTGRWKGADGATSKYVFPDPETGGPLHKRKVQTGFQKAVKAAKIRDLHFHDLRRTFASRLCARGASLNDVADLLGHGATYVTERYRWMSPDHLRKVMGKLSTAKVARFPQDGEVTEKATG